MLSTLFALVLYGALFLALRGVSWSAEPLFPDRLGPVEVTLEPLPPRSEPEPEPVWVPESIPEPEPVAPPEEDTVAPVTEPEQKPEPPSARRPPEETVIPGEGGLTTDEGVLQSEGEGEALPVETEELGVIEEAPPLDIRGESRVIYAEDTIAPDEERPGESKPETEDSDTDGFELDDEDLDRALDNLPPEDSGPDSPGTPAERGEEPGNGGPEHIDIDFDTPGTGRKLLSWRDPELSPQLMSRLPPRTEVVIRFAISPEGHVSELMVSRSSGAADVDAAVMTAMRKWQFEKGDDPDIRVEAVVRYVIQTR